MWRAIAIFVVVLPAAALIAGWIVYRGWRRTPLGQARRADAERAEQERPDGAGRRIDGGGSNGR